MPANADGAFHSFVKNAHGQVRGIDESFVETGCNKEYIMDLGRVNRRSAIGLFGSGALLSATGAASSLAAQSASASFIHGIASGDPTANGAILWTPVTPQDAGHGAAIPVRWHVATSQDSKPVETGTTEAGPSHDFTVKVEPRLLKSGREYWYWFELADGTRSPQGRFRTLPKGKAAEAVFAVVSCQLYSGGYFNVYKSIAQKDRIDAVIHLGDYIYEYSADGYGAEIGRKLDRLAEPAHEILTLADYRTRHAQYKRDPDLQAAHARAAFICVWDDHESANDAWIGGAENHQVATEGDWAKRKAAAMQAYFEWLPIRDPQSNDTWAAINRSFEFGDLATLLMVQTRLLARSEQAQLSSKTPTPAEYAALLATRARPDRELLGEPQREWVEQTLGASVKAGTTWQVIGNQVVTARVNGPDLNVLFGEEKANAMVSALPAPMVAYIQQAQASDRAGVPFNLDAWDGYPAARERLYASFRRAGSRPLVLAGDSHAFWANNLADDQGHPVAVEFGTSSITSPSFGDVLPGLPLGEMLEKVSPEVAFCDMLSKGYILLTLTPQAAQADYIGVSTVLDRTFQESQLARFNVDAQAAERKLKVESKG
ncbi:MULTISPECIES: alkaline phosphatase [unclassified Novosphingobium]|uniref:alkaline phosphatase D family protein n=1 Tax=unclassified Novosphingobium TaxID=2644732 RepID=UPI001F1860E3|nr:MULTISPECIES: alkaline phosphatase D family protein [unclassified Novosphingobium]